MLDNPLGITPTEAGITQVLLGCAEIRLKGGSGLPHRIDSGVLI